MTEPPPKRFQIHLSTAIVMMFVAGILLWANVREYDVKPMDSPMRMWYGDEPQKLYQVRDEAFVDKKWGWPLEFLHHRFFAETEYRFMYWCAGIDFYFAACVLLAVWFLCEWLIRHRAAQKGA
jgi:hypothetical protein